jgi:hypothetical protein
MLDEKRVFFSQSFFPCIASTPAITPSTVLPARSIAMFLSRLSAISSLVTLLAVTVSKRFWTCVTSLAGPA